MTIGAVPSKRIPEVVDRITDHFVHSREQGENFCDFIARIGKKELRSLIENLMKNAPSFE